MKARTNQCQNKFISVAQQAPMRGANKPPIKPIKTQIKITIKPPNNSPNSPLFILSLVAVYAPLGAVLNSSFCVVSAPINSASVYPNKLQLINCC